MEETNQNDSQGNQDNQNNQIDRIKRKLIQVKQKDKNFTVFGSKTHKYELNKTLAASKLSEWEEEHLVRLPRSFAQFLTKIGHGGAGPYYGIYTLDKMLGYKEKLSLSQKCILYPNMANSDWNKLIELINDDEDISDEEYDDVCERILGGMLCFGTLGCEYDMYIVLEGKYTGRIVYTSYFHQDDPFFFTYENNFLDWYERWLDEILWDCDIPWFGTTVPGNESDLILTYQNARNKEEKSEVLRALSKFKRLSPSTLSFLKSIIEQENESNESFVTIVRLICETSFDAGKNYLLELLKSEDNDDFFSAVKIIHSCGKTEDSEVLINIILDSLDRVIHKELFSVIPVLGDANRLSLKDFERFLTDPVSQINAMYLLGNYRKFNEKDIDVIEHVLSDGGNETMKNFISYFKLVPHIKLLPYYKAVWHEYKDKPVREQFIVCLNELNLPENYFDID